METATPHSQPICWQSKAAWAEDVFGAQSTAHGNAVINPATCMMPAGHAGPHVWVPDTEIMIERL